MSIAAIDVSIYDNNNNIMVQQPHNFQLDDFRERIVYQVIIRIVCYKYRNPLYFTNYSLETNYIAEIAKTLAEQLDLNAIVDVPTANAKLVKLLKNSDYNIVITDTELMKLIIYELLHYGDRRRCACQDENDYFEEALKYQEKYTRLKKQLTRMKQLLLYDIAHNLADIYIDK